MDTSALRPDRIWLVVAAVAAVVLVVGGVSLAVRGAPDRDTPGTSVRPTPTTAAIAPPTPAPGVAAVPETGSVRLAADAAEHPSAAAVVQVLDRHFSAINDGDYDRWSGTVVPQRAADQSRASWKLAFRSTVDESVVVERLETTSYGVAAELSFVSRQALVDAPPDLQARRICWSTTWPVENTADDLLIGTPADGATSGRAC